MCIPNCAIDQVYDECSGVVASFSPPHKPKMESKRREPVIKLSLTVISRKYVFSRVVIFLSKIRPPHTQSSPCYLHMQ